VVNLKNHRTITCFTERQKQASTTDSKPFYANEKTAFFFYKHNEKCTSFGEVCAKERDGEREREGW